MKRDPSLLFEMSRSGVGGWLPGKPESAHADAGDLLPAELLRQTPAALPEVSELDVIRHFTRISQTNACIDTHFYPLGSCTMKYNPRATEKAARIPAFADSHPLAGDEDVQGTLRAMFELQQALAEVTGLAAVGLHSAAGAQGELAGILIARDYHRSQGEERKTIVIPDTAHGTNPASAHLGGFDVVTVKSNDRGRTDVAALKDILNRDVALFMLTNPNTLGLFEEDILEIAELVHKEGALLYMDGANLNALVGLVRPGDLGFDILHINTHKTFSTPHGGGGPGAGPVAVAEHLADFLPGWVVQQSEDRYRLTRPARSVGMLRGFFGSTGVLLRAFAYILALGAEGLKANSEAAILNANYLRVRLGQAFAPYVDEVCMHECVLSATRQKKRGARAQDIAKRLLDFGFHPPTTYFPLIVDEALMIEPTESENKETLDAFAEALLLIDQEIDADPELVRGAPTSTPVGRLDEVKAAREPILTWKAALQVNSRGAEG